MLLKCFIIVIALSVYSIVQANNCLTVYTYRSFISNQGPGEAISRAFESQYGCRIRWIALDNGVSILNRIRLEGKKTQADVIVGLDKNLMLEARRTDLFATHTVNTSKIKLPNGWNDNLFIPYDYGYFAFIYHGDRLKKPPETLQQLIADSSIRVLYPDPRTSSAGQGLMLWMKAVYGDRVNTAWQQLAKHTVTVTKGWTEAYHLFLNGEADMLFSYTLSPAYQAAINKRDTLKAAYFTEGHYMQVEVAAKIAHSTPNPLADKFMAFLLSDECQSNMLKGNWMYPVTGQILEPWVANYPVPDRTLELPITDVDHYRREWNREWQRALVGAR